MKDTRTDSETAALSQLFSSRTLRELSRKGYSPTVARLLHESDIFQQMNDTSTLSEVFEKAFCTLQTRENRHEYVYKNAIAQKILFGKHSTSTSCMLTEFRAGPCKADVVILNGTSLVYEIKSERDKLSRLDKQLEEYLKIFDNVNVISGENHLSALEKCIPSEVGIQVLTSRFQIRQHRCCDPIWPIFAQTKYSNACKGRNT